MWEFPLYIHIQTTPMIALKVLFNNVIDKKNIKNIKQLLNVINFLLYLWEMDIYEYNQQPLGK